MSWAPGRAQQVLISEPISMRNDYGYELIGRLRDRILIFRDKSDGFEVQAFDAQMHLSWSRKIEDIDRRGVQVLSVIPGKNDFSIIYKLHKRGDYSVHIHKYDPGAVLIDSATIKVYSDRVFTPPDIDVIRSDDRNCIAVFNKAERGSMEVSCFRTDKMQLQWDKIISFDDDYYDAYIKGLLLSDDGAFFVVSEYNNRKGKLEEHTFRLLQVSSSPDLLFIIPMQDFLTSDVKFAYDPLNRQLIGAGLFGEKNRDRTVGAFYIRQPLNSGAAPILNFHTFDDKFMSILRRKDVADDTKGITDADVSHLLLRRDGGAVMVVERHHEIQRGSSAGRGFWRDGVRMVVDYYYDDVFLICFLPNGQLQWNTVLHKRQYSQDDQGIYSSYFLFRSPETLHFMFNDEIKYENTCSEYLINPAGAFDRNSLFNTVGQGLRFRFRDGLQISANECILPSEFRNKLRIALIQL